MGSTPLYDKFWSRTSGKDRFEEMDDGAGQPFGAQNKGIQESFLENFKEIAENSPEGTIDDWIDEVDPTLTYQENKQHLLDLAPGESPFKVDREWEQEKADARVENKPEPNQEFTHDPRYEEPYVIESPLGESGLKSIGGKENRNKRGENEVVTSPQSYDDIGDEYGFHRIAVTTPLVAFLDRIAEEYELRSRSAAIEAVISEVDIEHFQDEHGKTWQEWIEVFQASREFRVDVRRKGPAIDER